MTTLIDRQFGAMSEMNVHSILEKQFGMLTKTNTRFAIFDFENDDCVIELKTRRNRYNSYPTTMIGANKIQQLRKLGGRKVGYFVFSFTDGVYYIKYDEERFKAFDHNIGGRGDRGKWELNEYCFIPITELSRINN